MEHEKRLKQQICSSSKTHLQEDCDVHPMDVWDITSEQATTTSSVFQAHYRATYIRLTYSDVEQTLRFLMFIGPCILAIVDE